MKHYFSLLLVFALALSASMANAQSLHVQQVQKKAFRPTMLKKNLKPVPRPLAKTGLEATYQESVPASDNIFRSLVAEKAGETQYDLQSNGCEPVRLNLWPNGDVSGAWVYSNQADGSGWSDRGTAVNYRTNGTWGPYPTARVEGATRTGFGNYVVTSDGTEFVVGHRSAGGVYYPYGSRRTAGSANWVSADIPSSVPKGCLWYKAAADGNNIYVLGLTSITAGGIGGAVYNGMDGHVLFWRSKDAGLTWDIKDGIIPGLDSSAYYSIGSESYTVVARDGIVAVGVFDSWNDAKMFKSTDGGTTWNAPVTIFDFPLTKYKTDQGYTTNDIPLDTNAPDTLAIFTNDGAGSMVIDVAGNVHAWFGEMYVLDNDLTDANTSYYPGINGLVYWNELTPDALTEIAISADWNGNDTLDIESGSIIGYGCGLSSMAASATSDDGSLYVAYSANVENLYDFNGKNLRHVYALKSEDLGQTWSDPIDVQYATDTEPDSAIAKLTEAVWPSAYKNATNNFRFLFQSDYEAGSAAQQTGNQNGLSDLIYIDGGNLVGLKKIASENIELSVNPNPATDNAVLSFNLKQASETSIEIVNMTGEVVKNIAQGKLSSGIQTINVNTANMANGLYFVRVLSGKLAGTQKLVVLH